MRDHADLVAEARAEVATGCGCSGCAMINRLADALESAAADTTHRNASSLDEMASALERAGVKFAPGAIFYAADHLRALADEAGRGGGA